MAPPPLRSRPPVGRYLVPAATAGTAPLVGSLVAADGGGSLSLPGMRRVGRGGGGGREGRRGGGGGGGGKGVYCWRAREGLPSLR